MTETSGVLRLKVGLRYWVVAVIHSMEPPSNLYDFLTHNPEKPDVYLFLESDEDLRQRWIKAIATQCGEEWKTCFVTGDLTSLDSTLLGPCLVIGTQRLLQRFCDSIAPNESSSTNRSKENPPQVESEPLPSVENLDISEIHLDHDVKPLDSELPSVENLDISEIPSYLEEGHLDPFGQNLQLLDSAWSATAEFLGLLAQQAHAQGLALTLPYLPLGQDDSPLKPWRMVVSLETLPDDQSLSKSVELRSQSLPDVQEMDFGLDLIQRCLLVFSVLSSEATTTDEWRNLGEFIENLGYILISHTTDILRGTPATPDLHISFQIGQNAARIHSINSMHGDLHLHNVLIGASDDQNPMGTAWVIDPRAKWFDHPITALERAKDLALLKLQCNFYQWEALKLGYRSVAAKEAEEVFQLI